LFVITSPVSPGVVIQLDAHVASLLGMTFVKFSATNHKAPLAQSLAMTIKFSLKNIPR
jgi:hypothetical protein